MDATILLGDIEEDKLQTLERASPAEICVILPLRYIGSSNSYLDVCADILDASWACEKLGTAAGEITVTIGGGAVSVVLRRPNQRFAAALRDCALVYDDDELLDDDHARRGDVRSDVADFEIEIEDFVPKVPELVDWYLINLVHGANSEIRSEDPDAYRRQMEAHPERQVDYIRSAYRHALGHDCYASADGWICPAGSDLNRFFELTGQKHRLAALAPAHFLSIGGRPMAISKDILVDFPIREFMRSQICTGYVRHRDDDDDTPFDWLIPPYSLMPASVGAIPGETTCLVDPSGSLVVVRDQFWRILSVRKALPSPVLKTVQAEVATLADTLAAITGGDAEITLDWSLLDDERFEQLCYDLIAAHPRYDADTIRKLGKSRSRDGGRDIQVHEHRLRPWEPSRKWIFQCKLYSSGSLGTSRVRDVGDMLDEYKAQGFGVMASVPIDATLYSRLDGVCEKRSVEQHHWSVYEIERALARNTIIKRRYFGS